MTTAPRRAARILAAVALCLSGLVLLAPTPATAELKPGFTLKPGEKKVINSDSPLGMGKAFPFGDLGPESCDTPAALLGSDEFCHSYAVTIDASDDLIRTGRLQLNVVVEFDKGPVFVANCPQIGNCGGNEMAVELWQNPPSQYFPTPGPVGIGECEYIESVPDPLKEELMTELCPPVTDAFTQPTVESTGFFGTPDSPLTIAHVGAGICAEQLEPDPDNPVPQSGICKTEFVGVGNYTGQNPYTLTVELVDFTSSIIEDLTGIDDFPAIEDFSAGDDSFGGFDPGSSPTPGTLSFDVPAFPTGASTGAPRVDLPGLGSSAGFDGFGAPFGASDLARKIVDRGPRQLGAAPPANRFLVLLWLVALPLGGLGSFLFFLWRRRREDDDEAVPAVA